MANMPHPSRQAVTWRLRRDLVGAVRQAAAQRGETVLAFVTRALTREVERTTAVAVPDRVADAVPPEQEG